MRAAQEVVVPDGERGLTAAEWANVVLTARVASGRIARRQAFDDGATGDDLFQDAMIGALDGLTRFDRSLGLKPTTLLYTRIHGAVVDAIRERNSVVKVPRLAASRGERLRVIHLKRRDKRPDAGYEHTLTRGPFAEDVPARPDPAEPSRYEFRMGLRRAFGRLDARTEDVLVLHFFDGWTLKRIANEFGVSESRVSQLVTQTLADARGRRSHGDTADLLAGRTRGRGS
jgi:RNA polymerase sigma factor (sigma-70 family)